MRTTPPAIWALLGLLLAACAPAAPSVPPAAAPTTAPGTSIAAGDAAAGADWDATLAAARREGKLVVSATAGQAWRDALTQFAQDYPDIELELTGGNAADFWPRLQQERAGGVYRWDLRAAGFGPDSFTARDNGVLDPLRPLLVLPEVADQSKWLGGLDALFMDKEKQYLVGYAVQAYSSIVVNRDVIPERDLATAEDLLHPRWSGQIAMNDPRQGGSGLAVVAVFLRTRGEPYVRELLGRQNPTLTSDYRQMGEWVVRGRYPIGIGIGLDRLVPFWEQGIGKNVHPLAEPLKLSSSSAGIHLINRAPNPNAAKVFANWLLTRDVQTRVGPKVGLNSRRTDVPLVDAASWPDAARLAEYTHDQYEDIEVYKRRGMELAKEILP
jgi:iron(III) transport system substrate-binding protein